MMFSSSLLVIMMTGTSGMRFLISASVSRPERPGMFSSRIMRSYGVAAAMSRASAPLQAVSTS